jgi:PAS domain S-box-containing protein
MEDKRTKDQMAKELHALRIRLTESEVAQSELRHLRLKLSALEQVVDNLPLGVTITNLKGRILYTNPAEARMHGYTVEELVGRDISVFVPGGGWTPMSPEQVRTFRRLARDGLNLRRDGSIFHVRLTSDVIRDGQGDALGIVTTSEEITREKQEQAYQEALYKISNRCSQAGDFRKLCGDIHNIVGGLIFARNFIVALQRPDPGLLDYVYHVDEFSAAPAPTPPGKGLVSEVLKTGEYLFASQETLELLVQEEGIDAVDTPFVAWLGVPLKSGDRVLGLLAIRSYTEDIRFGREEQELLTFVAQLLSGAVVRLNVV